MFLFDPAGGDLQFKLRDDWEALGADEDDQEYLACLEDDFQLRIREVGAGHSCSRSRTAFPACCASAIANLSR